MQDESWLPAYRRIIWIIPAGISLLAAGGMAYALKAGSDQLFKDSFDWIYDVLLYGIAALVFGRGAQAERATAGLIAAILTAAALHTLYDLGAKIANPRPIDPAVLQFSAYSAVAVGFIVLAMLWRFRLVENPLVTATWISARNSAIITTIYQSVLLWARLLPGQRWPEWGLDLLAAVLLLQGAFVIARSIWRDRRERRAASANA